MDALGSPLASLWSLIVSASMEDVYIYYCFGRSIPPAEKTGILRIVTVTYELNVSLHVAVSPLVGVLFFILVNVVFGILDVTGRPRALVKYKIQEEKPVPVSQLL